MILDRILREKKREIAGLKEVRASLSHKLRERGLSIIAELKKASPSKGVIAEDFSPLDRLAAYENGGAAAISVLTDETFFAGREELLKEVRAETELPLLRKDFIIDEIQVYQSLLLGADCILLIAEILEKERLEKLLRLAGRLNMEALVEVHSPEDIQKALAVPVEIIGINNRNLEDFSVDLKNTEKLLDEIKRHERSEDILVISESGISCPEDVKYLAGLGVDGILVGEALMRAENPAARVRSFLEAGKMGGSSSGQS